MKSSNVIHQLTHNTQDRTQPHEIWPMDSSDDVVSGPRPHFPDALSNGSFATTTLAIPDLMRPIADDYYVDVKALSLLIDGRLSRFRNVPAAGF